MLSAYLLTAGIMQQHKIYLAPDTKTENQKLLFTRNSVVCKADTSKMRVLVEKKLYYFYTKRGNLHQYLYYRQ